MENKTVYLDHAATTPVDTRVRELMLPFLSEKFGNPSSFHTVGKIAADAIAESRAKIAKVLNIRPDEIIFTSGGTEADNLAVLGFARANKKFGNHIVTTKVEHPAVLEAVEHLVKVEGFEVTYVPVDQFGMVDVEGVLRAITEQTILVSIIYANNEIGTIQDLKGIANICHKHNMLDNQHQDASQRQR